MLPENRPMKAMTTMSFPKTQRSVSAGDGDTTLLPELEEKVARDAPWNVLVHNDPVNLMRYVVMMLRRIFGFSEQEAEDKMLEVHQAGRAVVWTGNREKAELYVEQLHSAQLNATMEKSED